MDFRHNYDYEFEKRLAQNGYPNPRGCLICRGEVPSNKKIYIDALRLHEIKCEKRGD